MNSARSGPAPAPGAPGLAAALLLGLLCLSSPQVRAAPAVTLFAAGDIAECFHPDPKWSGAAASADLVEAQLAATPGALVLLLGDNGYPRGSAADYRDCYHPTWGRFKARTHPAPGNREYATRGAAGYFGYFGSAAGPGYYRLNLGNWSLFSLDSNLDPATHAVQLAWLKEELARRPARCMLAYWHHPLYSSGGHGSIARMRGAWELLVEAGAELVLSGHDHDYERFAPQDAAGRLDPARGMRQFVVGTGGAFVTPFLWPLKHSEVRDNSRSGVLKLVLEDAGYSWEFLEAAPAGFPTGQPPDRGSDRCH